MGSFITGRNGGQTDELGFTKPIFDMFRPGYTSGWSVSQRGAGANMSVDVAIGAGNIEDTDRTYYGWTDAVTNVTISAADPTNPRRDIIVAYEDKSVVSSASANNPNALKFKSVAGTPAGSPVDPSGATIQASVGAGNPYVQLARVAVAAAASNIVNANITDLRTPAALAVPYLYGGGSNTNGHLVPNVADDTVALLNATQTFSNKTLTSPTMTTPVIDQFGSASGLGAAWTTFTPTWTSSGTAPAIGNGTLSGRYQQIGKTINFYFNITFGSTTTFGTGNYTFALPVTTTAAVLAPSGIGTCYLEDSGVQSYYGMVIVSSTALFSIKVVTAGNNQVSQTTPVTWGSGDFLRGVATYEAA